jgi:uncharacterized protein YfaS (alpha-2-macroglobulin family)
MEGSPMSDVTGLPDRTTSAVENLLADFGMELLAAPTPCTERTVSELLDHLAQQSEPSDDPRLRYANARTEMVSAWRRLGLNSEVPSGPFGETPLRVVCTTAT